MMRIVLFTPFAPHIGGGGAILRSLLPPLENEHNFEIEWCYTAEEESREQQNTDLNVTYRFLGPDPVTTGWRSLPDIILLWGTQRTTTRLRQLTAKLESLRADTYWIVGHMEAVLVADQLARHGHRVHLTMHDDLAYGQFARSKRYRYITALGNWRLKQTMRRVRTMDVVCKGMKRYYREICQKDSITVHRYVSLLPPTPPAPSTSPALLKIGHIGSIYSVPEFRAFCVALRDYARKKGLELEFEVIAGYAPKNQALFEEFEDFIISTPHMDEAEAIKHLSQCHFVYAMYPFSDEMEVFRRTSSPTKITTYIQAQRPILGHTPSDSSLHEIITTFKLGQSCNSLEPSDIERYIETMYQIVVKQDKFEAARATLHGDDNIRKLAHCLKTGKYPV